MKIPSALLWFFNFSNIGGITQFRQSESKIAKRIWFVLFVFGCIMTIYGVQMSINNYLEYRSVTSSSKEYKSLLEFPSVTICNLNKVHCGNLNALIERCDKVSIKI